MSINTVIDIPDAAGRRLLVLSDVNDEPTLWIDARDYEIYKEIMNACKVFDEKEVQKRAQRYICTDSVDRRILKLTLPGGFSPNLPDAICGLPKLMALTFRSKQKYWRTNSLSPSVCQLINLTELRVNHLESLPDEIGNLCNLTTLYLGESRISTIPRSIGRLINLKELHLDNDEGIYSQRRQHLSSLPNEIGNLSSLVILHIISYDIGSLPRSIGRLKKLRDLNLTKSLIRSNFPEEIGELNALVKLNLHCTGMVSLPKSIGRLKNLRELNLSQINRVSNRQRLANLPYEIGALSSLVVLDLRHSNITSLPRSIGSLTNLKELDLRDTVNLSNLPEEIGYLSGLICLRITDAYKDKLLPSSLYELMKKRARMIDPIRLSSCGVALKLIPILLVRAQGSFNTEWIKIETAGGRAKKYQKRMSLRSDGVYHFLMHHRELFSLLRS